ncbi:probable polygalacturonase [Phalaenopsis equestris]|uniref:probable polygalacturonase n=1 Tax=Phalaenopsis equestris TaxID=78828 RepID=UPI0009E2D54D|nr:probable polygalacturonase [Phalaenopsis equestris]
MKRLVALLLVVAVAGSIKGIEDGDGACKLKRTVAPRPHSVTLTEFGAVGDGVTLNTIAFQNAIFYLRSFADKGGAQLYVPKGKWLTGSFNLISHLTLFLDRGAVIIGTQDLSQWPTAEPLPSYGRGIELPGRRYLSLINGNNLTDIAITGDNGIIDGLGSVWWDSFHSRTLNYSRPHLIELVNSKGVLLSNLTFINPPAWTIHPVYCSNLEVHNITVFAPSDSPFTNGVVPDSSSDICIKDSNIAVGHDAISIKSGWDEYGISYSKPSSKIQITNVFLQAPFGSALSFGSEMSGGISDIHADHLHIYNSKVGINFKTTRGRGGFIKDILISDTEMNSVQTAIQFTGYCGGHPDNFYDSDALPVINRVTIKNVFGTNVSAAGALYAIEQDPFTAICLSNVNITVAPTEVSASWNCSYVSGFSQNVFPEPCSDLQLDYSNSSLLCYSLVNYKYIPLAAV